MQQKLNASQQNDVTRLAQMAEKLGAKFGRGIDPEEAQAAALSELCLAVLKFDPNNKLSLDSYVELSIKNCLKNWRRRHLYERKRGLSGGAPMRHEVIDSSGCGHWLEKTDDADKAGCYRDLGQMISCPDTDPLMNLYWQELLDSLPKDIRPLAYAKWLEKRTHAEIATLFSLTPDTVDRRMKRAEQYAKLYLNGGGK